MGGSEDADSIVRDGMPSQPIDPDKLVSCSHGNIEATKCCCFCRGRSDLIKTHFCRGHGMIFTTYCADDCLERSYRNERTGYCPCAYTDRYGRPYEPDAGGETTSAGSCDTQYKIVITSSRTKERL